VILHTNWERKQDELINAIQEKRAKENAASNEGNGTPESRSE
jgi:hypothetical protein